MEPTKADDDWFTNVQAGYIGIEKPRVKLVKEGYDRHSWKRYEVSKRLQIPESELTDEPDNSPDDPEQAWA